MLPPGWKWPHLAAALLAKFLERFFLGGLVGLDHSHRVDWAVLGLVLLGAKYLELPLGWMW